MEPIGLQLIGTGRLIARAFDEALAEVGGSLPEWLVLVSLKAQHHGMQQDLAEAADGEGRTLAHRLSRMEADGLVRRSGEHRVELTEQGQTTFNRFLKAVVAFDRRLRTGVTNEEIAALDDLLGRLRLNVSDRTTTESPS